MPPKGRIPFLVAHLLTAGAWTGITHAQTWVGPADSLWSDPANWSTSTVPNSPFDDVLIDGNAAQETIARLDTFALLRSVVISSSDELNFNQNTSLTVFGNGLSANIVNGGRMVVGQRSELLGAGGSLTFTGGGRILLEGSTARIAGAGRVINVDNTIAGDGQIGANAVSFTNNYLIKASVSGQAIVIDPAADGPAAFLNNGTLSASSGWLLLTGNGGGGFSSTSGYFSAAGGTIELLSDATITGGTFQSSAGGRTIVAPNQNGFVTNISNDGHFVAESGSTLTVDGEILNNGSIELMANSATPAFSTMRVNGTVNFSGNGDLILRGSLAGKARITGTGLLINSAAHRIIGHGNIGNNLTSVQNDGAIIASSATGPLVVDPGAAMLHNGEFIARNLGTLQLSGNGGQAFSGVGSITVDSGATLELINGAQASFTGSTRVDGVMNIIGPSTVALADVAGLGTVKVSGLLVADHVRAATIDATGGRIDIRPGGGSIGTSRTETFTGGTFDLADHALVIDYNGPSPLANIAASVQAGYASGSWNGNGIRSIIAANDPTRRTGVGYAPATAVLTSTPGAYAGQPFDATSIIAAFTINGDANLDQRVNLDDFTGLAAGFGNGAFWFQGDFNNSGAVNLDDFTILAANFGQALPNFTQTRGAVPEPAGLACISAIALVFRRRRVD